MAIFKQFTPEEQAFWEEYSEYSYKLMRRDLAVMLGVEPKRISVSLLREHFYTVGVQPHEFMIRRTARYPRGYMHRDWEFELRFAGPEVVSLLRLAGIIT